MSDQPTPDPEAGVVPEQYPGALSPLCGRHYVSRDVVYPEPDPRGVTRRTQVDTCTLPFGHDGEHGQAA